jgi:hypothetical protein
VAWTPEASVAIHMAVPTRKYGTPWRTPSRFMTQTTPYSAIATASAPHDRSDV